MKKVLWFSRHALTVDQTNDLKRIYGEFEIEQVNKSIKSIDELKEEIERNDILAVVLPEDLLCDLKSKYPNKKIIISKSDRILLESKEIPETEKTEYIEKIKTLNLPEHIQKRLLMELNKKEDKIEFAFAGWYEIVEKSSLIKKL